MNGAGQRESVMPKQHTPVYEPRINVGTSQQISSSMTTRSFVNSGVLSAVISYYHRPGIAKYWSMKRACKMPNANLHNAPVIVQLFERTSVLIGTWRSRLLIRIRLALDVDPNHDFSAHSTSQPHRLVLALPRVLTEEHFTIKSRYIQIFRSRNGKWSLRSAWPFFTGCTSYHGIYNETPGRARTELIDMMHAEYPPGRLLLSTDGVRPIMFWKLHAVAPFCRRLAGGWLIFNDWVTAISLNMLHKNAVSPMIG
jgi:hypothetical protein